jgi:hypothetical protein
MYVDAHVLASGKLRLAGVHPHADAHPHVIHPGVGRELALGLHGRADGIQGARKGYEERVALRTDHAAIVRRARLANNPLLIGEQGRVFIAELLQQAGGAFNIGEKKRYRSGRKIGHGHSCGPGFGPLSFASMRGSGMSHMTATIAYSPVAKRASQKATGIEAA